MARQIRFRSGSLASWLLLVCMVAMLSGCGGDERSDAVRSLNSTNSKRVSNLYDAYQQMHNWRGPKDEESFKAYIEGLPDERKELIGIVDVSMDELFVSERDGKPFRIRYKVRGSEWASDPVVFEDTGVDGSRMVGFTGLKEREVTAEEYDKLWASKSQPQDVRGGRGDDLQSAIEAEGAPPSGR